MSFGSSRLIAVVLSAMLGLSVFVSATPTVGGSARAEPNCTGAGAKPVSDVPVGLAAPGEAIVTVAALNLRAGPGTDCPIVGSLGFGMQVHIANDLLNDGKYFWRKVTTPIGEGYTIASAYETMPAVAPTAVPVLMYHHIDELYGRYSVSPEVFAAQLAWLKENGYVSITPQDLYNARYNGMALPARPVMLTIDDGNPSTATFKHLLDQYGFRGVYFLPNYTPLSADQIRGLADSGQVCGHTVTHPSLERLDVAGQHAEIVNNKTWLEGIIGRPVTCFAYPFGTYNDVTNQVIAASGYLTAFNAWGGVAVISVNADPFHILRVEIYGDYDLDTFVGIVTGTG
jgi:peptidoglycan/xylan/chitin deacetylase (PgdA/CDA1 family)